LVRQPRVEAHWFQALLLDAVRQGWIRPPLSVARELPARKPVMKINEILEDLQSDRAHR
jgi:hypothetical protein